jgi:hypothetical protein
MHTLDYLDQIPIIVPAHVVKMAFMDITVDQENMVYQGNTDLTDLTE